MMSIIFLETLNIYWGQIDPNVNRRVNKLPHVCRAGVHAFSGEGPAAGDIQKEHGHLHEVRESRVTLTSWSHYSRMHE